LRLSQHVFEPLVSNACHSPINVFGGHANIVQKELDVGRLISHSEELVIHSHLALHKEVVGHLHHCGHLLLHHSLDHYILLVLYALWIWLDVESLEVVSELPRNLSQHLLCKAVWVSLQLSEGYELDDVPGCKLAGFRMSKRVNISVKRLHLIKVGFSNTDDDD